MYFNYCEGINDAVGWPIGQLAVIINLTSTFSPSRLSPSRTSSAYLTRSLISSPSLPHIDHDVTQQSQLGYLGSSKKDVPSRGGYLNVGYLMFLVLLWEASTPRRELRADAQRAHMWAREWGFTGHRERGLLLPVSESDVRSCGLKFYSLRLTTNVRLLSAVIHHG